MAAAMDLVGNPSSVHAEGRAAQGAVERGARAGRSRRSAPRRGPGLHLRRDRGGGAGAGGAGACLGRRSSTRRCWPGPTAPCRWTRTGGSRWPTRRRPRCSSPIPRPAIVQDLPPGLAVSDVDAGRGPAALRPRLVRRRHGDPVGPQVRRPQGRRARCSCRAATHPRPASGAAGRRWAGGPEPRTSSGSWGWRPRLRRRSGTWRTGSGTGSPELRNILETGS